MFSKKNNKKKIEQKTEKFLDCYDKFILEK